MEHNLARICRLEAGKAGKDGKSEEPDMSGVGTDKALGNRMAFAATLSMLKEKTGRKEFSMQEMMDPMGTIKKYQKAE